MEQSTINGNGRVEPEQNLDEALKEIRKEPKRKRKPKAQLIQEESLTNQAESQEAQAAGQLVLAEQKSAEAAISIGVERAAKTVKRIRQSEQVATLALLAQATEQDAYDLGEQLKKLDQVGDHSVNLDDVLTKAKQAFDKTGGSEDLGESAIRFGHSSKRFNIFDD